MQISYSGKKLLGELEGFKDKAYKDSAGIWSLGFGSIRMWGRKVQQGDICTEAEAYIQMDLDLAWAQTAINKEVKVPLTQNQFDALVIFIYNIGETAFKSSTMLRKLNAKDYIGAANEFVRWNRAGGKVVDGLTNRREREKRLFLK